MFNNGVPVNVKYIKDQNSDGKKSKNKYINDQANYQMHWQLSFREMYTNCGVI